ncbi:hypothetical protein AAZX31_18G116000 [Glycine max]|uniref:Uncharacterized protein n=2 Tax=Glycine subgen. Soja TaxID=1462606 RepID=K7MRL9_SOYBN|nr:uncharacterized protein LOC102666102 isoform X3 [Glycine max]KAG4924240.1 hypothetical protein JHK87_049780 [Glycine soja]KAH1154257.1 hypothetical protein GYH30_049775 [Glycine max]KAH1154258.1 hypothetical protein GYH30_049775 [Glycine max]KHN31766.1 hypothetical protein glysoja_037151 [Glycine soja]KRG99138.1 hypothetical protein GLYMA_18G124100v4 [Glycine max]|eukprot:XP_014625857.1 uncharacterized protein LOC102666102 isoform X2 [Glycine max]
MNNISLYQVPLQKYVAMVDLQTTRGLPPGLVPISEPYFDGELPEVELIVVDTSKFDDATTPEPEHTNKEDKSELYKPKVSTWGVIRRPGNISKTFGGGRVICPGEVLESKEEKVVKEARTKQLLAAYNNKTGLNVDPKLKSECEELSIFSDIQILQPFFPSFIHAFPFYAHCWVFFVS